jgi:hypothetical protein
MKFAKIRRLLFGAILTIGACGSAIAQTESKTADATPSKVFTISPQLTLIAIDHSCYKDHCSSTAIVFNAELVGVMVCDASYDGPTAIIPFPGFQHVKDTLTVSCAKKYVIGDPLPDNFTMTQASPQVNFPGDRTTDFWASRPGFVAYCVVDSTQLTVIMGYFCREAKIPS